MINAPIKNFNKETRKLLRRWLSNNLETLSVGKIINIREYSKDRLVDVLPLPIDRAYDGQARVPDVVYRCPVVLEGNLDGYISYPVKVGDKVILGYCKQSIAEFIFSQQAEQYLPSDLGLFGANDAVVLGFIAQAGKDKRVSATDFELNYKNSYLKITPADDITLNNPACSINLAPTGTITSTNQTATAVLNSSGEIDLNNPNASINIASGGTITADNGTASGEISSSGDITFSNSTVTITATDAGAITVTTSGNISFTTPGIFSVSASSLSLNGATINGGGNLITAAGSNVDDIYQVYDTHTHGENDNIGTTDTDPPTQQLP